MLDPRLGISRDVRILRSARRVRKHRSRCGGCRPAGQSWDFSGGRRRIASRPGGAILELRCGTSTRRGPFSPRSANALPRLSASIWTRSCSSSTGRSTLSCALPGRPARPRFCWPWPTGSMPTASMPTASTVASMSNVEEAQTARSDVGAAMAAVLGELSESASETFGD